MSPEHNLEAVPAKPPLNAAWWLLIIGLVHLSTPFLPVSNLYLSVALTIGITLLYVGSVVGVAQSVARKRFPLPEAVGWLALCALAWVGVQYLWQPKIDAFFGMLREVGARPTPIQILTSTYVETVQDLALIAGAMFAGSILARMIKHPNLVGPIGIMVALIDIWGVLFSGPVSKLLASEAAQPIAAKAMAAGPKIGAASAMASAGPQYPIEIPSVGVGDYLFIALLLSVLVNLAMNWRTPTYAMWLSVCAALLAITFLPFVPALPGLLFIGLSAVIPNVRYFTFTREEKFALLYAGIFVLILTVVVYIGLTRALGST